MPQLPRPPLSATPQEDLSAAQKAKLAAQCERQDAGIALAELERSAAQLRDAQVRERAAAAASGPRAPPLPLQGCATGRSCHAQLAGH
jgi:hypothetical protein